MNKGPGRPAFNENLRALSLSEIESVDYVAINTTHSASNVIRKLRPNYYCKGPDYKIFKNDITNEIKNEAKEIRRIGGKILFTSGRTFSSSKLINNKSLLNQEKKFIFD